MRFLHTADWHLGRTLHGVDLRSEQAAVTQRIVELAIAHRVDAVLLAGDVHDRAIPPLHAVEIWEGAIEALADAGIPLVAIAGNHDSAQRLAFGGRVMDRAGIHLRSGIRDLGAPLILRDAYGEVRVFAVPYLEPDLVAAGLGVEERSHEAVIAAAMTRVRASLADAPAGTRAVVVGHAVVSGGVRRDSERVLRAGGSEIVPAALFDGIDYVALGHLHRPQRIADHIRYSGSPLAYSFSERDDRKRALLVELDGGGLASVESLALPGPRPLALLRGTLDELLGDLAHAGLENAWLSVTLTDAARPEAPMERLRRRFPHVLALDFDPQGAAAAVAGESYAERIRGRSELEIAERFVLDVRGTAADDAERELLEQAFTAGRIAEAAR